MDDTQTTSPATEDGNAQAPPDQDAASGPPGFGERGRMRRRMRFLRKARELAYRDLGGLVFDLHRFGRRNDALVLAKLETIGRIDTELRALEATLAERRPVTVLREAGVAACPRCAAIHGSDDRFCPNCGLAMDLRAERPMAGPQSASQATPAPPAPAPVPAPTPTATHTAALATHTPAAPSTSPGAATTPTPDPSVAPPPGPSTATPDPATPAPAAPSSDTAPSSAATPAPSTPAPSAAHPPPESTPEPPKGATPPAGPAPAIDGDPPAAEERPNVDQPTEIVRPPVRDP